jgi:uncharacterized glyoxalase superfamily protein PhnB
VSSADVSDLVPFVRVANIGRSIAFYERLGFTVRATYEPKGRVLWAALENASARLMLAHADAPNDPPQQAVLFYLYVRDLAALRERLLAAGVPAGEIEDGSPSPKREMQIADPDGHCLMIAEIEDERVRFNQAERRRAVGSARPASQRTSIPAGPELGRASLRGMERGLLARVHNPQNHVCACLPTCWCKHSTLGYALRWYVPARHHRLPPPPVRQQ